MFNASTFDVSRGLDRTMVFDSNGVISTPFVSVNPTASGYTPYNVMANIAGNLDGAGYDVDFNDMLATYGNAIFHVGFNVTSTYNPGGGAPSVTTYYIDNGITGTSGMDFIFDAVGNNIIDAGAGDDFVAVGGGDDAVSGGEGNDTIYTAMGNDIVDGGEGNDVVFLYDGNDFAKGGKGNDELYGEAGNDKLWGQQGKDYLDGGLGNDKLYGGGGKDQLFGDEGNDVLKGGGGNDQLYGGEGNDKLFGGNGNDLISGGTGKDKLTGNSGEDNFIYNLGDDNDTITDFDLSDDTVSLDSGFGFSNFTDLMNSNVVTQVGNDVVFDFGNGDTLTLLNTVLNNLAVDDFAFI